MRRHIITLILIFVLSLVLTSMSIADDKVLPSKFRKDMQQYVMAKVQAKEIKSQKEFQAALADYLKKNIALVKTTDLPVEETLILGELHASTGDIKKARATVSKIAMGKDVNARKATQIMIKATIAANRLPEAENQIRHYRKKFVPTPDDLGHLSQPVLSLAMKYSGEGKPGKGVKVLVDQLESLPRDQPYKLYTSLAYAQDVFESAGETGEFVEILGALIKDFEKAALKHEAAVKNKEKVRYANAGRAFRHAISSYESVLNQLKLVSAPAPVIEFTHFYNTEKINMADLKGKVVMIDFWANWCGPCKGAFPSMAELYDKYKDQGFVILGVTSFQGQFSDGAIKKRGISQEEELKLTEDFIKKYKMTWPVVFSKQSVFNKDYGVTGIPTFAVLDKKGIVRLVKTGSGEAAEKALHEIVAKLIKE